MDGVDNAVQGRGGSVWRMVRGTAPAGAGAAFAETFDRHRQTVQVWLTEAAVRELAELLERELSRQPSGSDPVERVASCLLDLQQREVLGWSVLTRRCEEAGIAYDRLLIAVDGTAERSGRWCPILRDGSPDGNQRSAGVTFHPPRAADKRRHRPFGVGFHEFHQPGVRGQSPFEHAVQIAYTSLQDLLHSLEAAAAPAGRVVPASATGNPVPPATAVEAHGTAGSDGRADEDRLVAALAAVIAGEPGGAADVPGRLRDAVAERCRLAGIPYELAGHARRITLLDEPDLAAGTAFVLTLSIDANRPVPEVTFAEVTQRLRRNGRRNEYALVLPLSAVPQAVAHLAARFPDAAPASLPAAPADQLAALLKALAEGGPLGPGQPQRGVRDRLAAWLSEGDVPHTMRNHTRDEPLLEVWREGGGCAFTLRLRLDPVGPDKGIWFTEEYDYVSRGGMGSREDFYTVRTPYASLAALVAYFEERGVGTPDPAADPEDRLVAALARLVATGELADGLPIAVNQSRVAAWFAEAGVPARTDHSVWMSMD